jgi:hypothetical protein
MRGPWERDFQCMLVTLRRGRRVMGEIGTRCVLESTSKRQVERRWRRAAAIVGLALSASVHLAAQALPPTHVDDFAGHPRVIVISDIGNEPDDQMSFVRLLLYSNELDIEAMIATTSTWQKTATHPETMRQLIDAYGQVRPNLLQRQGLA